MIFLIFNTSNPLEIEVITVSIPLSVLFILLYFLIFRRRKVAPSPPPVSLPTPVPAQQNLPEQKPPQEIDLTKVMSKMDKMQSDLSKTIVDNNNELKNLFENLNKNLEDLALSIKASKSDQESPFNVIAEIENKKTNVPIPLKKSEENELVSKFENNEMESIPSSPNLKKVIQLSTLLAVMDYDKEKLMALHKLDLLSANDFELLVRIEDVLAKNKKITASDLAIITFDLMKSYSSADPDSVKYVSLVLGDRNGGRDNK